MNLDILDKFTTHLRGVLSRSIDLAWEHHQESIPPIFLLLSIAEQTGSIGADILGQNHVSPVTLAESLHGNSSLKAGASQSTDSVFLWPEFSPSAKKLIERAAVLAYEHHHQYIGTEHLLTAMLNYPDKDIASALSHGNVSVEAIKKQLTAVINSSTKMSSVKSLFAGNAAQKEEAAHTEGHVHDHASDEEASETPALDYFGTDLTAKEQMEKLDPVIGRDNEIERLIHILSRRSKNNPVLIGEPGVGKTAIVEGLAKRIVQNAVPDVLLNKRLIQLDLSLVIAGTMYRGEFESRLKQIVEELQSHPDILIFIDEIHTIVGTGSVQSGTLDAANILKPALAKGVLHCIGATTAAEYRKHIEQDPALDRRFQPIYVSEPTEEEAVQILSGVRKFYEQFHHVTIPDDVIAAAVRLSSRYIPDKRLPDKAIDLIDEAGAKAHVGRTVPDVVKKMDQLSRMLKQLRKKKEAAVRTERFTLAVDLKKKEALLIDKLEEIRRQVKKLNIKRTVLTEQDIARVVAHITNMPAEHILTTGQAQRAKTDEQLRQAIIGQDDAIQKVAAVLKRSYAGLSSPNRPLGSFLFLGPSGVGKTELAKILAEKHFGSRASLIRMDMSEFSEGFTVSKLIGAPAGYIGYNDGIKLSDHIRRNPYSVVLFDELEKAHSDIFHLLLQILDEGRLTDASGRELNFRNTVIIMTSNVGIDLLTKQAAIGFEAEGPNKGVMEFAEIESTILGELTEMFPQEFLNRIDHQIVFRALNDSHVQKIVDLHFAEIQERLRERQVKAQLMPSARKLIARKSFSADQGARRVRKTLASLVEDRLAEMIVDEELPQGSTVKIKAKGDQIVITQ